MKTRKHIVAATTGSLVCLLLVACQKDEVVAPQGVDNTRITKDAINQDDRGRDPASAEATYDRNNWGTKDLIAEETFSRTRPAVQLEGKWELTSIYGEYFRLQGDAAPYIIVHGARGTFVEAENVEQGAVVALGTMVGFSGCNRISSSVHQRGNALRFIDLRRGRDRCAYSGLETRLIQALITTDRVEQDGDEITLFAGRNVVAVFHRDLITAVELATE